MLKDADSLAAADKRKMMLDPGTGTDLDAIVQETLNLPPALVEKIAAMIEG